MVELFFDLVFVFAVTQLSHSLLAKLTPLGALQTFMLLLAVWSLWNYTVWATNALDPERISVRLLLFALMLAGLVVSMLIPSAFQRGAWLFASGYVLMHTLRCSFILWAARAGPPTRRQNYQRNLFWVAVSALFWFAGAGAEPERRLYWWMAAIGIELISPWLLYWTPDLGPVEDHRLGDRRRPYGRTLCLVRHHRLERITADHRCDVCRGTLQRHGRNRIRKRVLCNSGHVVDLLS